MLSVLSYNILFGRRVKEILSWLSKEPYQYDILCFQEFPKQKIALVKKLVQPHSYAYASNVIHKGKDYGQLTVLVNKKITLVEESTIWLGTNFFEDRVLKLEGERSSLLTKLRYDNKEFLLANTHLIAFSLNALKRKQLAMVVEHLEGVSQKKKIPTIVLGDFNYSSLFWRGKFFDYMDDKRFKNAHTEKTHTLLSLKQHQLDYIFYKHCQVNNVKILQESFSDHFPMTCNLKLPSR